MRAYLLILILAVTGLSGCKKFLDVQPKDLKIAKTVKDYQDLMNGEGWSKSTGSNVGSGMELYWLEMLTDDVTEALATAPIPTDSKKHYSPFYIWRNNYDLTYLENSTTSYNLDTWTWLYRVVNISNIVLEAIDEMEGGTESERQLLKAEAYFSRALAFYYLTNIWGEPYQPATAATAKGIPLKTTGFPEIASKPRNSVQECYDQMINDLSEAESIVTSTGVIPTGSVFHVSKEAVEILLSRVYLYMQNWEKAKEFANKAIETKPALYDITTENFTNVLTTSFFNSRNKEILFSYHRSTKTGLASSSYIFGTSQTASIYVVAPEVLTLYTSTPGDKRLNGFINTVSSRYFAKTMIQESGTVLFDYAIRTAEAYLNRAEAKAQLNDLAGALSDLNALRAKRITGSSAVSFTDKEALLNFIYQERRREFFFQGHRWFDLRRTGMPSITHFYTPVNGTGSGATFGTTLKFVLNQNDPGYTIELPAKEMLLNPGLVPLGLAERQPQ